MKLTRFAHKMMLNSVFPKIRELAQAIATCDSIGNHCEFQRSSDIKLCPEHAEAMSREYN